MCLEMIGCNGTVKRDIFVRLIFRDFSHSKQFDDLFILRFQIVYI